MNNVNQQLLKRVQDKLYAATYGSTVYTEVSEARTGKRDPSTGELFLDPTEGLTGNFIWVRPESPNSNATQERAAVAALCKVRNDLADLPVYIGYDRKGYLTAFDGRADIETSTQYQQHTAAMSTPVQPAEFMNQPIADKLILGGLVTASATPGLTVAIQSFNTTQLIYPTLDPFDVSASVPGTSGQVRWTVLSAAPFFDMADPAASIALSDGPVSTMPVNMFKLTTQAAAEIVYPAGNYRLGAVMLFNGQIVLDDSSTIINLREGFGAERPLNNYAGTTAPTITNDASEGYSVDSLWFDNAGLVVYWCSDATIGAAVWNAIGGSGSSLSVTDGMTTVIDVDAINFVGASVTDLGGGVAEVTITGGGSGVNKDRFTQTANATVANTTTPTTLLGSGQGSTSFDIDAVGRTVEGELWGVISTLGVLPGSLTIEVSIGGTTVLSTGAVSLITSLSNVLWNLRYRITVVTTGGSGTVIAEGKFSITNALADSVEMLSNGTSTVTVDTTGTPVEDVQATFSAASTSNSITTTNADLRFIDPNVGSGGGGGGSVSVAIYEEQQPSGTNGGISSSGVQTRVLNTEVSDINNIATLSSNQITISNAGTYLIEFEAQCFGGDQHQAILYDITNSAEIKRGRSLYAVSVYVSENTSSGRCVLVLTASRTLELRHFITTARVLDGLGTAVSNGTEVYSRVTITQLT